MCGVWLHAMGDNEQVVSLTGYGGLATRHGAQRAGCVPYGVWGLAARHGGQRAGCVPYGVWGLAACYKAHCTTA